MRSSAAGSSPRCRPTLPSGQAAAPLASDALPSLQTPRGRRPAPASARAAVTAVCVQLACEDDRRRCAPGARAALQPWTFTQQMSAAPLHARCVCTSEQPRKQADLGCVSGSHAGRAASPSRSPGARGRSCRGGQLRRIRHQLLGPPCPARKLRTPAVEVSAAWSPSMAPASPCSEVDVVSFAVRGWTVNEIPSTPCPSPVRRIGDVRS